MSFRLEYASHVRPFRQFSSTQQALILEVQNSDYSIDKITTFGLRPPELLFVAYVVSYLSWFTITSIRVTEYTIAAVVDKYVNISDVQKAYWMDGANRLVRIKQYAIPNLYDYTVSVLRGDHGLFHHKLEQYFNIVIEPLFRDATCFPNLVDFIQPIPPVIVSPLTLPSASGKWLVHLALFYGRYTTESELFGTSSLLKSYEICGLYDPIHPQSSVVQLLDLWARNELRTMPGSHRAFSRNLAIARYVLQAFMCDENSEFKYLETPLLSLRQIEAVHTEELDAFIHDSRKRFIEGVSRLLALPDLPSIEALLSCSYGSPLQWEPCISSCAGQSSASVSEQRYVLNACINTITRFLSTSSVFVPSLLITGSPGCGKTSLCLLCGLFARGKGLEVTATALSSERAMLIGGYHIHSLFCIGVNKGARVVTASEITHTAITKLRGNGLKMAFLLSLDVIVFDECGLIDQCLFSALSDIMCTLRKVRTPFGGTLLLLSGDAYQLSQISGRSLWSSSYMHSLFDVYELQHQVRCAEDPILQRCISILRDPTYPVCEENKAYLCSALIHNCKLLSSVEEARDQSRFTNFEVYSKRCSEQAALAAFNAYLRERESLGQRVYTSIAEDELNEGGLHSTWKSATSNMSKQFNKYSSDPYELKLAVGLVLRFTRNGTSTDRGIVFSQGQLGICRELPNSSTSEHVGILLVPVGIQFVDAIDVMNPPTSWTLAAIHRSLGYDVIVGAVTMRRRQYPLKNHISSTIHKSLGLTVPQLTTRLATPTSDNRFALWEKQQLLVVISRVRKLTDITLINTPDEIRQTVTYLLDKRSTDMTMVARLLKAVAKTQSQVDPSRIILRSRFDPIPLRVFDPNVYDGGCVYCLTSTTNADVTYIGCTSNIYKRLNSHNRGLQGASFTAINDLMPWRIAALIIGFPFHARSSSYNKSSRAEVEHAWHILIASSDTLAVVLSKGKSLLSHYRLKYPYLKFVDYCSKTDTDV